MLRNYAEYTIEIHPRNDSGYPLSVDSPGGEARGVLVLPTADPAYQELIYRISIQEVDEAVLVTIGKLLFNILFQGQLKEVLVRSQGLLNNGQGLRIKLNIAATESEVAALPWELLYDPDRGPLALLDAPILRYIPLSSRISALKTKLPLKVLLTSAQTFPKLDVERELLEVQEALGQLGEQIQIVMEPHLTRVKFQRFLREDIHVWHFVGHGGFQTDAFNGHLYFEDPTGDIEVITARELGIFLHRSSIRLVVLNACNSAKLVSDPFRSIAPALIRAEVPAVIAMQFKVPVSSARAFAGEMYRSLAAGLPIDASVTEGRKAIMSSAGLRSLDWAIPVVYSRAADGILFDLSASALTNDPKTIANSTALRQPQNESTRDKGKRRIFISYKRNADPDEALARNLYTTLRKAGHDVFIDQVLQVGMEWLTEIERHIETCDFMVVLLSESSIHSEMLAKEIEYAHHNYLRSGKSRLLPIRINYNHILPYQLSHYLDKLQYAQWHTPFDNESLIDQLLDVVSSYKNLPFTNVQASYYTDEEPPSVAPNPYADPRFVASLIEPSGAVRLRSGFYIHRDADDQLHRELGKSFGTTITIRAPRQTGKSSLLSRGILQAREQGAKIIYIDLQPVEDSNLQSLDTFLRYFTNVVIARLQMDPDEVDRAWKGILGPSDKTTYLFENYILQESKSKIVLAIDEADKLLKAQFHGSFFGLIRFWHNSRAMNEIWDKVSILMAISTEPHLLISDVTQSPFNVGLTINLEDFNLQQVHQLNLRYRSPLDEVHIPAIASYLNGHPYLTSKALYTLVTEKITWERLLKTISTAQSPFSDHLRRYLWMLHDQSNLKSTLNQIIRRGSCDDEASFYRLLQAGLVTGTSSRSCGCRCLLYEEYFKDKL